MLKTYYSLTKPGIIYANVLTAAAGFFLASKGTFDIPLFAGTIFGIALIIASASVFNNYFDRHIDARMERTKNRALPSGSVHARSAIIFGTILFLLAFIVLYYFTNTIALLTALSGFLVYVCLYTPLKHHRAYAALVGSISGAVPPVFGYGAASGQIDAAAVILFFILALWQMPHFYAIALNREKDYSNASIPVLPQKIGSRRTKVHMLLYIFAFSIVQTLLFFYGYTGYTHLISTLILSIVWLSYAISGFRTNINERMWARKMFIVSLLVLSVFCVMLFINAHVP